MGFHAMPVAREVLTFSLAQFSNAFLGVCLGALGDTAVAFNLFAIKLQHSRRIPASRARSRTRRS